MINKRINKVEAKGDNIFIFQYIDSAGNKTEEKRSLEEFLKPFIGPNEERIKELKVHLADKTELLGYKDSVVIKLSDEIQTLKDKNEQLNQQISQFLEGMEGKDLSQTSNLYQTAFELFTESNIDEAIEILDDAKMEEEENRALDEMMQRAETRLLKAKMLKIKNRHNEAAVNYEKAVELFQSWVNCLEAANYFAFINDFNKAEKYYSFCIQNTESEEERATTLNNLAVLQSDKNEYKKAEASYLEALEIRRKLAEVNPQTYLPYVATTLNNLANLQSDKNEYKKAEASYLEALEIRRKLAELNPQTYLPDVGATLNNLANLQSDKNEYKKAEESYLEALKIRLKFAELLPEAFEIPLADTFLCLSNLYRHNLKDKNRSLDYAKKAVSLYGKYPIPHAEKWEKIAQENIDYWNEGNWVSKGKGGFFSNLLKRIFK